MEKQPPEPVVLSSDEEDNNAQNDRQIILYDPGVANGSGQIVALPESDPNPIRVRALPPKVLPSVGAFTVQCAQCYKWRLIPSKEKYEEIREHILEKPFSCEIAKGWRPEISCDDPGDIEQDGSRLWAIDKPSIAQPPPGWERELRIRGEGSSKFADVYYIAPSGKRLRSMVEVQKYLLEHPEYISQGVTLSQFSFQIPKPLQENYVRKRTARLTPPFGDSNLGTSRPTAVSPISWAPPDDATALQLGGPGFSGSYTSFDGTTPPVKKKARSSTQKPCNSDPLHKQHRFKIKGPRLPPHDVCDF